MLEDLEIHAIKTGMLYDSANTRAVVKALKAHYQGSSLPPLICDPVCVSTSGHTLLEPQAIQAMIEDLFPMAWLITPNKSEAELLLSHGGSPTSIKSVEDMLVAAKDLMAFGSRAVLLKGGHLIATIEDVRRVSRDNPDIVVIQYGLYDDNMEILQASEADITTVKLVVDVLHQAGRSATLYIRPRIDTTNTHGTGCTLSAALACEAARGLDCASNSKVTSRLY